MCQRMGQIKTITMSMEVSFEMKIENLFSIRVDDYKEVLNIDGWFWFGLRKSAEESKYYITNYWYRTLGEHDGILKLNPISCSNNWKKEFLETILKTQSFNSRVTIGVSNAILNLKQL